SDFLSRSRDNRFTTRHDVTLTETHAPTHERTSSAPPDLTALVFEDEPAPSREDVVSVARQALDRLGVTSEVVGYSQGSRRPTHGTPRDSASLWRARPVAGGYGHAFRDGIAAARGNYVVVIDSDFPSDPDVLRRLWEARGDAGVVIASRYVPGGRA